jgi:hypothetical protein
MKETTVPTGEWLPRTQLARVDEWHDARISGRQVTAMHRATDRQRAALRGLPAHQEGEPLTAELSGSLAHPDQERLLATLAARLRGVHNFPVADAAAGVEELASSRNCGYSMPATT